MQPPFSQQLHRLLREVEEKGQSNIVSFLPHGRAFLVFDIQRFVSEILPIYYKQNRWHSFGRQLNLYGFTRIQRGRDSGAYYHELFLRGRPSLCRFMKRVGVPREGEDRRKKESKSEDQYNPDDVPDFYSMKPVSSERDSSQTETREYY